MAELQFDPDGNTEGVDWDFSDVLSAGESLILAGKHIREFATPLTDEVRRKRGLVFLSDVDLIDYLRRKGTSVSTYRLNQFLESLSPKAALAYDRLRESGNLGEISQAELHEQVLKGSPILSSQSSFNYLVYSIAEATKDQLVLYDCLQSQTNYLRLAVPFAAQAPTSRWILLADEALRRFPLPVVNREYLRRTHLAKGLGQHLSLRFEEADGLISRYFNSRRSNDYARSFDLDSLTYDEYLTLVRNIGRYSRDSNLASIGQEHEDQEADAPIVPRPRSAPIQFRINDDRLDLRMSPASGRVDADVIRTTAEEIRSNVVDVFDNHGIRNASPTCAAKLSRITANLEAVIGGNIDHGRVLSLGVGAAATREFLERDGGNLGEGRAAVQAALSQVELFVNQFDVWQEYIADSAFDTVRETDDRRVAKLVSDVLKPFLKDELATPETRATIDAALGNLSEDLSVAEKIGFLRVAHNLVANVLGFLRRLAKDARDEFGVNSTAATKVITAALFWQAISSIEATLRSMAEVAPAMFGWIESVFRWLGGTIQF